jgi:hypothetical protein
MPAQKDKRYNQRRGKKGVDRLDPIECTSMENVVPLSAAHLAQ